MENEKKKNCARQRLEWLLPISSTGSRPSFEVVTGRHQVRRPRAAAHDRASARPRPGQRAHDLGKTGRGRDIALASRPRLEGLASRHFFCCCDLAEIGLDSPGS